MENLIEKYDHTNINKSTLDNALVVMANSLARNKTKWSAREIKLFLTAVSQIDNVDNEGWVTLNKRDIIEKFNIDPSDISKLRQLFKSVAAKSWVEFDGDSKEEWEDGFMMTRVKSTRKTVSVLFANYYLPLVKELKTHFTWFYLDNIAHFTSKQTICLYKFLRSWHDRKYTYTHKKVSLEDIKKIFELSPTDYTAKRKNKKTGKESIVFDLYNFEKYVLNKAIAEINEEENNSGMKIADCIKLRTKGDKGFVTGYEFVFCLVKDGTPDAE